MKRSITSITLLLFCAGLPSQASTGTLPCSPQSALKHLFPIEATRGTHIAREKVDALLPYPKLDYVVEELGSGKGGTVYRIIPKHHPEKAFIAKHTDTATAAHDYIGFELIRKAVSGDDGIKIARVKVLPTKASQGANMHTSAIMQVENIEGKTLFSVLADPKTPHPVRAALRDRYKKFVQKLEQQFDEEFNVGARYLQAKAEFFPASKASSLPASAIEAQPQIVSFEFSLDHLNDPFLGVPDLIRKTNSLTQNAAATMQRVDDSVEILIKSDNILVTPNYDLYLIDPH